VSVAIFAKSFPAFSTGWVLIGEPPLSIMFHELREKQAAIIKLNVVDLKKE
jgi:hypothetical protein